MISGTITAGGNLYVGHTGVGTVNMTGGTITTPTIVLPHNGAGHVNLDGGILGAGTLNMKQVEGTEIVGTMDVGAGTLILNGNDLAVVQGYIDNGWITAYEGQGTLNLDYDDVANQTTLTARHNLNPFPADGGAAAAGAVEAAVCVLTIHHGRIPVNANLRELDAECEHLDIVHERPRERRVRIAMSNSLGFGGSNSCLVLRAPEEIV